MQNAPSPLEIDRFEIPLQDVFISAFPNKMHVS